MKALHLLPSFHQGGSESQGLGLARRLASGNHCEVTVTCLDKSGPLLGDASKHFKEIEEFRLTSFYDANMAVQLQRFARYLRSRRFDIVQTHDFYSNIFGMLGSRLSGVPLRIAAKRETGMRSYGQFLAERGTFRLAQVVVVNSYCVRDYLIRSGVAQQKIEVIYNGIDHELFANPNGGCKEIAKELGLPDGLRLITIVANLRDRVKNHEMFIRAARKTAAAVPEAAFVIAGEGERKGLIMRMAADAGLQDRVYFTGRCSRVADLLAVSEICVLTSDSEGMSNSILEYMAAGKPVVATNVGGASEAVVDGATGFLIQAGDDGALSERILQLLENREVSAMFGRKGAQRVRELFSTQNQVAGTMALYERELSKPTSAAV